MSTSIGYDEVEEFEAELIEFGEMWPSVLVCGVPPFFVSGALSLVVDVGVIVLLGFNL